MVWGKSGIRLVLGLCAAVALPLLAGCSSVCDDYCEAVVPCVQDQLDEQGCSTDKGTDALVEECGKKCDAGMEAVAPDDQSDFEDCAQCVVDNTGKEVCDGSEVQTTAGSTCEKECDNDRMANAWQDFGEEMADWEIATTCPG